MTERDFLRQEGAETRLIEQMKNRMAVETGIIEGLYDLDRGITETLITEGFKTALLPHADTNQDPQLVIAILRDQRNAIDYIFELVKRERELSTSVIKELHWMLTEHQPTTMAMDQFGHLRQVELVRGEWKHQPNNPTRPDGVVHVYCPPEQVASEMDRLIDLYRQYESIEIAPEVLAAWLHHRFAQIHPFQDGNGRVARLLASIVFLKAGWHPLVVLRDDRPAYIDALEKADEGSLAELITLFTNWQRRAFVMALGASNAAREPLPAHLDDVIEGLKSKLGDRTVGHSSSTLEDVADLLVETAEAVAAPIAVRLQDALRGIRPKLTATVSVNGPDQSRRYVGPRIELAKASSYFADFSRGSRWVRIMIKPDGRDVEATLLISTSALGSSLGSLAVVAGLITKDPDENRARTRLVSEESFIATAQDLVDDEAKRRLQDQFTDWANHSLVIGLAQWQRELA